MKHSAKFRKITRFFTLVVLGSAVITRTAGGAAEPDPSFENEAAWAAVREGMMTSASDIALVPERARRLVSDGLGDGFELRVTESYRAIAPDAVAHLDAMWMDVLAQGAAGSEVVDGFLAARADAMRDQLGLDLASADTAQKWDIFAREFKRAPYEGGD